MKTGEQQARENEGSLGRAWPDLFGRTRIFFFFEKGMCSAQYSAVNRQAHLGPFAGPAFLSSC